MATAKSTLLKTKRPGKDLNDPLFSDILAWTNDNASDLISGFFLQTTDWTKGQIDEAIKDLPGDIEQPQTARKYLRDSLPAKPLVSITNRELSKIVFAPAHKSHISAKPKTIVANIDLYIIAKRTPRPNHQGRGVLFVVEGTDPRLQPLPAGLNVLDKLHSIEVLGRVQGRIQGNDEDSLIKMGQVVVAPNAFRLLAQLAGLFNRTHPDPCEMIPMVRAFTGMGVQAGTELSRPGYVDDLLPV